MESIDSFIKTGINAVVKKLFLHEVEGMCNLDSPRPGSHLTGLHGGPRNLVVR